MSTSAPRTLAAIIVAGLALLMTGCAQKATPAGGGGVSTHVGAHHSSSAAPAATASFDGTWSGTWTRITPPPGHGTYTWVLHQQGNQITGTLTAGHSLCLTKGPLTGHVSGIHITVHVVTPAINGVGEAHATYRGTLAGSTLSGTTTVSCSVGVGLGTWRLTRH